MSHAAERIETPSGRLVGGHEWLALFTCAIGDGGMGVHVTADVTSDNGLDLDSIDAHLFSGISLCDLLNAGHRQQIKEYFDDNFVEIYEESGYV